jgi:hypothetical protein
VRLRGSGEQSPRARGDARSRPLLQRPGRLARAAEHAFVGGLDTLFLVGAEIAFAGALLALVLVRQRDLAEARDARPSPA